MKNKGFTMIELLAAIIILGILSTIAIVGVNRLIDKSREEELRQQKETVKMAAQAYMNDNPSQLPKLIGDKKDLTASFLKEKKYLKEDLKNKKNEDCMNKSFVRVVKKTKLEYAYDAHVLCGIDVYIEEENDKPTIEIYFVDSLGTEIDSYKNILANLEKESVFIKMTGGVDKITKEKLKLSGYMFIVYAKINGIESEVYNSGTLSANNLYEIEQKKKLSDYMDVTKATDFNIKVVAINEKGMRTEVESRKKYQDTDKPKCSGFTGQAGANDWINKNAYKNKDKTRTITANCKDVGASGCVRNTFTRTWPNQEEKSAEYGYIQVVDNAGNKNLDDNSNYLKNSCNISESSIQDTCRVRVNVDIENPKITVTSKDLKNNIIADDKTGNITINTSNFNDLTNGWMNAKKFGNGMELTVTIEDNIHLASYVWETNPKNIKSDNNKYSTYSASNPDGFKIVNIDNLNYSKNNCGTRQKKNIKITLNKEGMRKGRFTVTDKAGNKTILYVVANIDRTIPSKVPNTIMKKWDNTTRPTTLEQAKKQKSSYTESNWLSGRVVTYPTEVSDSMSGGVYYQYTTTGKTTNNSNATAAYRNIEAEGTSTIQWRACDKAGNCSKYSDTKTIKLDREKPTCKIKKTNTGKTSGVTLTTTCDDKPANGAGSSSGVKICVVTDTSVKTYPGIKTGGATKKEYTYAVEDHAKNPGTCTVTVTAQRQKKTCKTCKRCDSAACETWKYCQHNDCGSYCCSATFEICLGATCTTDTTHGNCTVPDRAFDVKYSYCISSCRTSGCGCKTRKRDCPNCGCKTWNSTWSNVSSCSENNSTQCQTVYN